MPDPKPINGTTKQPPSSDSGAPAPAPFKLEDLPLDEKVDPGPLKRDPYLPNTQFGVGICHRSFAPASYIELDPYCLQLDINFQKPRVKRAPNLGGLTLLNFNHLKLKGTIGTEQQSVGVALASHVGVPDLISIVYMDLAFDVTFAGGETVYNFGAAIGTQIRLGSDPLIMGYLELEPSWLSSAKSESTTSLGVRFKF